MCFELEKWALKMNNCNIFPGGKILVENSVVNKYKQRKLEKYSVHFRMVKPRNKIILDLKKEMFNGNIKLACEVSSSAQES